MLAIIKLHVNPKMSTEPNQAEISLESSLTELENHEEFIRRHIGPDDTQVNHMLSTLGIESLDALVESTLPSSIHLDEPLQLPGSVSEADALARLRTIAGPGGSPSWWMELTHRG